MAEVNISDYDLRFKIARIFKDEFGSVEDKLRLILWDFNPKRDSDMMTIFLDLIDQGYIATNKLGLLYELLDLMNRPDLLDHLPKQKEYDSFPVISRYRRMLLSVAHYLEAADCQRLADLYRVEEFNKPCMLMMHLEKRYVLKNERKDLKLLEENLKKIGCNNAAPLVKEYLKEYPEIVDRAAKVLAERYCKFCKVMKSLPWDTSRGIRNLKDIFINLNIVFEKDKYRVEFSFPKYYNIFDPIKGVDGYRILIRGIAGTGKTTIMQRISLDWGESVLKKLSGELDTSESGVNFVNKFKLLFFLEIRKIKQEQTIFEAVRSQLLHTFSMDDVKLIEAYIKHEPSKVLFLFDGYDELKQDISDDSCESNLLNALRCNTFPDCHMIVTTRPHRVKDFKYIHMFYKHFELKGFTREDVEKYVKMYFDNSETGDKLMKYIRDLNFVEGIAEIPIMTAIMCFLWESQSYKTGLPKTPSRMYKQLFEFLMAKYKRRNPKPKRQKLDDEVQLTPEQVLCKIGEMGLEGLQTEKDGLVFKVQELEVSQQSVIEQACDIGIMHTLNGSEGADDDDDDDDDDPFGLVEEVQFFHKSAQEKCAAIYLASLLKKDQRSHEIFFNYLSTVSSVRKALDMHLLLKFTCADSYDAAKHILGRLGDIYKQYEQETWDNFYKGDLMIEEIKEMQQFLELCIGCNYEADKNLKDQMVSIFPEGRVRFTGISNYTAMSLAHFLKKTPSIKHVELLHLGVEDNTQVRALMDKIPSCRRFYTKLVTVISSKDNKTEKEFAESFKEKIPEKSFLRAIPLEQMYGIIPMYDTLTKWQAKEINLEIVFNGITDNVKSLTISGLQIKGSDFDAFVKLLNRLKSLHNLCLNSNNLESKSLEGFSGCIGRMAELKVLTLSGNDVSDGFASILQHIQTGKLVKIEELWVEKCNLSPETLCETIEAFDNTPNLRILDIRLNEITNDVMRKLSTKMKKLHQLENLNMTTNNVDSHGYDPFFSAIKQMDNMKRLHIADSTFPGTLLYHIATVIPEMPNLEYLHASGKNVKEIREIPKQIFSRFIKDLPKLKVLKELNLVIIKFERENFDELINVCKLLPKLTDLRISFDLVPTGIDVNALPEFVKRC